MFKLQRTSSLHASQLEDTASARDPASNKRPSIAPSARGSNPAFPDLTARRPLPLEPSVTNVNAQREDTAGVGERSAKARLGKIPLPVARKAPTTTAEDAGPVKRPTFDDLPPELIRGMNLDPHQMQLVSRRYANIFHGEAVALSLTSHRPRVRSLNAVRGAVNQLERVVPDHLRHDPLAVLCAQLDGVPQHERRQSFDLLAAATQKCTFKFEPLTELFRQTNDWNSPLREDCQARLANLEGADEARVAATANDVFGHAEIPQFLERMNGLTDTQKSAALGALAKQLFSLPFLGAHDFARICESFHEEPWPPAAASGLLGRIGWISDPARASLTARQSRHR